jgi:dihydrofolate synthase/folylpolyglutamate synthase
LGGLLDGTNVITRADKVCIITDIGLDHTEVLGDTLEQISAQKAGIIQPENQIFMYGQGREVDPVFTEAAAKQRATLNFVTPDHDDHSSLLPLFQQRNFRLAHQAVAAALARGGIDPLTAEQIRQAQATRIPARMEVFSVNGKTIIVDGSHNGQKIGTLMASLRERYPARPVAALVAFVDGEAIRWQQGLDALLPSVDSLVITAFTATQDTPKTSVRPRVIADYAAGKIKKIVVEPEPAAALTRLLAETADVYLVVGSFYLLNHIRPLIIPASGPPGD